jgi:hypothetical protein
VNEAASPASAAVLAAALFATGCVATIHEERVIGPDRPATPAHQEVSRETRPAAQTLVAKVEGDAIDIRVESHAECREVRTTGERVRDVQVIRSFADDAQERNVAAAFLLGAAVGLLAYAANQAPCAPTQGGCSVGAATAAEYTLVGLTGVPLGFIGYNALRVRDVSGTEAAPPLVENSAWAACASAPAVGEAVDVIAGDVDAKGVTDEQGRVVVSLGPLLGAAAASTRPQVVVRHTGTPDLVLDLPAPAR